MEEKELTLAEELYSAFQYEYDLFIDRESKTNYFYPNMLLRDAFISGWFAATELVVRKT